MKKESQTSSTNGTAMMKPVKKKARPAKKAAKSAPARSVTTAKELLSIQEDVVPDLNTDGAYPLHPDRIWPD